MWKKKKKNIGYKGVFIRVGKLRSEWVYITNERRTVRGKWINLNIFYILCRVYISYLITAFSSFIWNRRERNSRTIVYGIFFASQRERGKGKKKINLSSKVFQTFSSSFHAFKKERRKEEKKGKKKTMANRKISKWKQPSTWPRSPPPFIPLCPILSDSMPPLALPHRHCCLVTSRGLTWPDCQSVPSSDGARNLQPLGVAVFPYLRITWDQLATRASNSLSVYHVRVFSQSTKNTKFSSRTSLTK